MKPCILLVSLMQGKRSKQRLKIPYNKNILNLFCSPDVIWIINSVAMR
jgi:NADH:ubiquinone oxidoreductase subunit F (NADH-binding)